MSRNDSSDNVFWEGFWWHLNSRLEKPWSVESCSGNLEDSPKSSAAVEARIAKFQKRGKVSQGHLCNISH